MLITLYRPLLALCFLIGLWPYTASAVVIEIESPGNDLLRAIFTEIDEVEGRVYTLDAEAGEISFGDGLSGARPPSGRSGLIGSYSFGGGAGGNIFNEFNLISAEYPLAIPLSELLDPESTDTHINFVLVGISALKFDLTSENLIVTAAEIAAVPEPATIALMGLGLAGLGLVRRHQRRGCSTKHS